MHCTNSAKIFRPWSTGTSSVVDKVKIGRTLRVTDLINSLGRAHPES
jgi:hypothetical protein